MSQSRHNSAFTPDEESEGYFASMTDLMVGVIFIFVIMLMAFALNYRKAEQDQRDRATGIQRTQVFILNDLKNRLRKANVNVEVDTRFGVLRLPESILFDTASDELKPEGQIALRALSKAMAEVLPCYARSPADWTYPVACADSRGPGRIEAVLVEGHSDKRPIFGAAAVKFGDNRRLSASRAIAAYNALTAGGIPVAGLTNDKHEPLLGVTGYGPDRPIDIGDTDAALSRNRRIDVRILMAPVTDDLAPEAVQRTQEAVDRIAP